ncbi:hypothetical protein B2J93_9077 [Marssonina coronariae]|uniref:Uncharacterized protein n=1 Tax=Diplocarpon coronariae TaxID=2795749 RepID=A0A218YTV6_9HELO|nr:hypothetical protein B2J93_9077 [Marssonina coronariae]
MTSLACQISPSQGSAGPMTSSRGDRAGAAELRVWDQHDHDRTSNGPPSRHDPARVGLPYLHRPLPRRSTRAVSPRTAVERAGLVLPEIHPRQHGVGNGVGTGDRGHLQVLREASEVWLSSTH